MSRVRATSPELASTSARCRAPGTPKLLVVRGGAEAGDDGNAVDLDSCTNTCTAGRWIDSASPTSALF